MRSIAPGTILCWLALSAVPAGAQVPAEPREMYRVWCAACHAADGTGRAPDRPVRATPLDFTDCRRATAESDVDWAYVIRRGGHAAGLSTEMPAFESLDDDRVAALVGVLRSFCADRRWPLGHVNFRRALFTVKAFPEDELALQPMVSHGRETFTRGRAAIEFEMRVGPRAEVEVVLPAESVGSVTGTVVGVGDIGVGGKYVLHAPSNRARIVTAGVEVVAPSGSLRWGFGEGTAVIEPYVAAAAMWRSIVLQGGVRAEYYTNPMPTEFYPYVGYDVSVSRDLSAAPSTWTLGVEVNGSGRAVGITPYIVKGLNASGTITGAFGVRLPISAPFPQLYDQVRWAGYLRWDYRERARSKILH
jgi:mono/diheme cytochrome c family protein